MLKKLQNKLDKSVSYFTICMVCHKKCNLYWTKWCNPPTSMRSHLVLCIQILFCFRFSRRSLKSNTYLPTASVILNEKNINKNAVFFFSNNLESRWRWICLIQFKSWFLPLKTHDVLEKIKFIKRLFLCNIFCHKPRNLFQLKSCCYMQK